MRDDTWPDAWTPLEAEATNLAPSLLSGMSFRWWKVGSIGDDEEEAAGHFVGVLSGEVVELKQSGMGAVSYRCRRSSDQEVVVSLLRSHLRLDEASASPHHHRWQSDSKGADLPHPAVARYRVCARVLPFTRVLKILDPWECLVTFMGSANNNIKRNMQMTRSLAAAFPCNLIGTDAYGVEHHAFPSVDEVASLTEDTLWKLGWGYRAPRLYKLSRQVQSLGGEGWLHALASEPDTTAVRKSLMELTGVGRKVADCILLFGFGRDGVVPVDTHCLQLAHRYLLPHKKGAALSAGHYEEINLAWHATFGPEFAGHAFMTMFVAELADFRKLVSAHEAAVALEPETPTPTPRTTTTPSPATPRRVRCGAAAQKGTPSKIREQLQERRPPATPRGKRLRTVAATAEAAVEPVEQKPKRRREGLRRS
jgi:3-methyladenine DNA glycosylase/8-oxoguanine DNA glycosylase